MKYLLIKPDEDGNPLRWCDNEEQLVELLNDCEITKFRKFDKDSMDPNYWEDDEGMVLRVEVVEPQPVEYVTRWSFRLIR